MESESVSAHLANKVKGSTELFYYCYARHCDLPSITSLFALDHKNTPTASPKCRSYLQINRHIFDKKSVLLAN